MNHRLNQFANVFLMAALLLGSQLLTASAADHNLVRISNGWDGSQADGSSYGAAISADGRYILFESYADNLIKGGPPKDANGNYRLYLFDQKTGKTELVSIAPDGSPTYGGDGTISADGRYVAFSSSISEMQSQQIYLRDRKNGKTLLVSSPTDGSKPDNSAAVAAISGSGRYIAFSSFAGNLVKGDGDQLPDIFVRDMQQNKIYLASASSSGQKGNSDSGDTGAPSISADGRYVAFSSYATNLVQGDTNGAADIFVHDIRTGKTERVSVSSSGKQANDRSQSPAISGDGRFVAFISWATNLVPADSNGAADVFVHDRSTGRTERVSVSSTGKQQTLGDLYGYGGFDKISMSFDGRYVTFTSQATNFAKGISINTCHYPIGENINEPCTNIYVHDRQTGRTSIISVSNSNKSGNGASYSPSMSQDGQWTAFVSEASNLVKGDTNNQTDIFFYWR
ncbi:MAG: hypothetical protein P4L50_01050 [Anaerolineaceae bacterium]|nr:hypothetical protein [Anaerolineaceae bacterium]